ncbi:MAG: ABC transporter ATP-binding protein [Chitinophagales bacterium]|jgi:ABC-type cobalamin/Fe3+-siderophores transport system ATPase subunit|nr:ABC transporter ATP-binding protein [Chitinophagales bacterium]
MISLRNFSIQYNQFPLIHQLNIEFGQGIHVIYGKNGVGKSTFFHALIRYFPKISGDIYIDELRINEYSIDDLKDLISWSAAHPPKPELYVHQLFEMVSGDYQSILNRFDLKDLWEKRFDEMSDGQRQWVFLCFTLCRQTKYVLFDEPTNHLDFTKVKTFIQILLEFTQHQTILINTHDMQFLLQKNMRFYLFDQKYIAENQSDNIIKEFL